MHASYAHTHVRTYVRTYIHAYKHAQVAHGPLCRDQCTADTPLRRRAFIRSRSQDKAILDSLGKSNPRVQKSNRRSPKRLCVMTVYCHSLWLPELSKGLRVQGGSSYTPDTWIALGACSNALAGCLCMPACRDHCCKSICRHQ